MRGVAEYGGVWWSVAGCGEVWRSVAGCGGVRRRASRRDIRESCPRPVRSLLTGGRFCVLFGEISRRVDPHRSQNCPYGRPARMRSCPRNRSSLRASLSLTARLHRSLPRLLTASWHLASRRSSARRCLTRSQLFRCTYRPRLSGAVVQRGRIGGFDPGACRRGVFERVAPNLAVEDEDGVRLASRSPTTVAVELHSHVRRRCGRQIAAVPAFASSSADSSLRAAASPFPLPGPATLGLRRRRECPRVVASWFVAPGEDCVAAKYSAALPCGVAGP